jgi:hypothetical protein
VVFASEFKLIETVGVASFVSRKQTNTRHCSRNNGWQLEKSQLIWKLIGSGQFSQCTSKKFFVNFCWGAVVVAPASGHPNTLRVPTQVRV